MFKMSRAAVKRLKTLRHPSVLTYVHSVESAAAVLLATEPAAPLQEHLELLVDRGPKRDNYLAWGIFQVGAEFFREISLFVHCLLYQFMFRARCVAPSPSSTTTPS